MVSIYDIAKEAGVSATTVSRVLHNGSCSVKTRVKVERAIGKLGYIPDARASSLKTRTTQSIGVIVPDIANPIYPVAIKAMYNLARSRGYHLIIGNTYERTDEEIDILQMLSRERVAGVILGVCKCGDETICNPYIEDMMRAGVKVVFCGRLRNGLDVDEITVDNVKGSFKAVKYLLRIGRKRIAFISGEKKLYASQGRFAGYQQALESAGITQDESLIRFDDWTRQSGYRMMESLLQHDRPDAVFCGNDLLAIGAIEAIGDAGLSVPDDIAVVGFDDIELASLVRPKLTTIVQPQERIGEIACSLLLDRIEGLQTGSSKEIMLDPDLVIRESA
jgi:LacI family transcriptional regulator